MATLRSTGRYQIGGGVALRVRTQEVQFFLDLSFVGLSPEATPSSRAAAFESTGGKFRHVFLQHVARVTRRRSHVPRPKPALRILVELALVARKSVTFASMRVQNRRKKVRRIAIGRI
jgi:hypothetical protein